MAFLQSDLPPSTAPGTAAAIARPRAASPRPSQKLPQKPSLPFGRIIAGLLAAAVLVLVGDAAARATESLAVGIMAADLAFLVAVAAWSSVAGGARR